jgi:hypothetical protein
MIASRTKWAGIVAFAGGAALAVLSGCAAGPATYQPPAYFNSSAAAMRAYLEQQQRAETYFQPVPAPRRFRTHPAPLDDGPVISQSPPVRSAPVPQAPAGPECVGMWRICHFL